MAKRKSEASTKRKKSRRVVHAGVAHIYASFNNTIITVTDQGGNALAWASAGGCGFRGARKSTPFAATTAVEKMSGALKEYALKELDVRVCGPGPGRESAVRALQTSGFRVTSIKDVSPITHNGVRPPKVRRV